jgi:predicted nucleic acid-binding protein
LAEPSVTDLLPDRSHVAFDANAVIYFVERHERYLPVVRPVFQRVSSGVIFGHASYLVLLEVLVRPLQESNPQLADRYRRLLREGRGFAMHALDVAIAERAALIRAEYGLRTPDSVVAATAIESECAYVVTNDPAFRRVAGFTTLLIEDFA